MSSGAICFIHKWSLGHRSNLSCPQGEHGTSAMTAHIAARPPFLRLMAAGIDRQGWCAASRREVSDAGIVRDHEVSLTNNSRCFRPLAAARDINYPPIPAILIEDWLNLISLGLGANKNYVAPRSLE